MTELLNFKGQISLQKFEFVRSLIGFLEEAGYGSNTY